MQKHVGSIETKVPNISSMVLFGFLPSFLSCLRFFVFFVFVFFLIKLLSGLVIDDIVAKETEKAASCCTREQEA